MANLDQAPSRSMPNLLHVLPAFADEAELRLNTIVELNSNTINKYELITETGHLKLDRVGYSSLAYPFAYGCIPRTWDEDGDPLDIEIVNVTEPLIPGSIVEARIIGVMTFDDGGRWMTRSSRCWPMTNAWITSRALRILVSTGRRKPPTTGSTTRI